MLTERLLDKAPTAAIFLDRWVIREERQGLMSQIHDGTLSATALRRLREMEDYDLYDLLVRLGYALPARTRSGRVQAFYTQEAIWFNEMPPDSATTLRAIVSQFESGGTESLESQELFRVPSVIKTGGVRSLRGLGEPFAVLTDMKRRLFAA
jgi:hypothetical protein